MSRFLFTIVSFLFNMDVVVILIFACRARTVLLP